MPTTATDSFTRPADTTAYAAADLVANSTTASSVVPLTFKTSKLLGQGTISRVRLYKSATSATNANFTLHLFTVSPVPANGDNGALVTSTVANMIGSVDCDMTTGGQAGTVGLFKAFAVDNGITFDLSNINAGERRLYGLLEANAAYTPASGEVFTVTLELMN